MMATKRFMKKKVNDNRIYYRQKNVIENIKVCLYVFHNVYLILNTHISLFRHRIH